MCSYFGDRGALPRHYLMLEMPRPEKLLEALPVRCTSRAFRGLASAGLLLASGACGVERVELLPKSAQTPGGGGTSADEPEPAGMDAPETPSPDPTDGSGFDDPASPAAEEAGCAKVDFLFVVDNSISMLLHQQKLSRSFPGFMEVVEDNLEASDFHIMVVDTDDWDGDDPEQSASDPCLNLLGSGKRTGSVGQSCGVAGTERYLKNGQENLSETFSCIAQVGTFGDSGEQPMDAMLQATSSAKNRAGGCNEGFLREDAILVVTFITDEDDENSTGNPETWRQTLLDAKGNDPKALVVLGLVGDNNLDQGLPGGPCNFFVADGAPALQSFVQSFGDRGSLASVCAEDYALFFERAVSTIDTACDEFIPPVIQ
jgi:hypothetical protein